MRIVWLKPVEIGGHAAPNTSVKEFAPGNPRQKYVLYYLPWLQKFWVCALEVPEDNPDRETMIHVSRSNSCQYWRPGVKPY